MLDGQCLLVKRGNITMLTLGITLTSDVSNYGVVATIPTGFRPDGQIWGSTSNCNFDITASGNVRLIGAKTSGQSFNISATYVTA